VFAKIGILVFQKYGVELKKNGFGKIALRENKASLLASLFPS
jgi:hypothetical protein